MKQRVVKFKFHAVKKVLLATKTNVGHKCRLCLHQFSLTLFAEYLIRIVSLLNFASSAVSSGNFFSCTFFCSTISLHFFFSKCSEFLFQKDTRYFVMYITKIVFFFAFKKHMSLFSDRR